MSMEKLRPSVCLYVLPVHLNLFLSSMRYLGLVSLLAEFNGALIRNFSALVLSLRSFYK